MKCKTCGGSLKISHTYQAGDHARTKRGVCKSCGRAFTITEVIQCEATDHGNGAYAMAQKLKKAGQESEEEVESSSDKA
jgi:hypothetical protein